MAAEPEIKEWADELERLLQKAVVVRSSGDTAKIAGTESTAKMMSLISRNSSATSSGVACQRFSR